MTKKAEKTKKKAGAKAAPKKAARPNKPGPKKTKPPVEPLVVELIIFDPTKDLIALLKPDNPGDTLQAATGGKANAKAIRDLLLDERCEFWSIPPAAGAEPSLDELLTPSDLRAGLNGTELNSALQAYRSLVRAIKDSKRLREGREPDILNPIKVHQVQSPDSGDLLELITKADFKELFCTPKVLAVKQTMNSYFIDGKSLRYGDTYHAVLLTVSGTLT